MMVEAKAKVSNSVIYELPEAVMEHDDMEDVDGEQVQARIDANSKKK